MAIVPTRLISGLFLFLILGRMAAADQPVGDVDVIDRVDILTFVDPKLRSRETRRVISNKPITVWKSALQRADPELQRITVDTITIAHQRGMEGVDALIPTLKKMLGTESIDSELQRAIVRCLIALDVRDVAPTFARLANLHGRTIDALVEPALAGWKSPELEDQWVGRVADSSADQMSLIHAMKGLGALKSASANDALVAWVKTRGRPKRVRIAAAQALGEIRSTGLSDLSAEIVDSANGDLIESLLAGYLLRSHRDEKAISVLNRLFEHENTSVQYVSLLRLYEIDPGLVDQVASTAIVSSEVNVRRLGARSLVWAAQSRELDQQERLRRIQPLATLLDDENPSLRAEVAAALFQLSDDESLRDEVINQAISVLNQNEWRGCEQATYLLVTMDIKQVGGRLIELMNHPRGEVKVASAWGLRRLNLKEHLPEMLEQAKRVYRRGAPPQSPPAYPAEQQVAQIFMAFGVHRYAPADELMREYLPKRFSLGETARPAAAWALGWIHEGQAPEDLTKLMVQRMNDVLSDPPESNGVRHACAVSLGRMKSIDAAETLRKYRSGSVGRACYWALNQLFGEPIPDPGVRIVDYEDWFLQSNEGD